jgi:hypothetical protein
LQQFDDIFADVPRADQSTRLNVLLESQADLFGDLYRAPGDEQQPAVSDDRSMLMGDLHLLRDADQVSLRTFIGVSRMSCL